MFLKYPSKWLDDVKRSVSFLSVSENNSSLNRFRNSFIFSSLVNIVAVNGVWYLSSIKLNDDSKDFPELSLALLVK